MKIARNIPISFMLFYTQSQEVFAVLDIPEETTEKHTNKRFHVLQVYRLSHLKMPYQAVTFYRLALLCQLT